MFFKGSESPMQCVETVLNYENGNNSNLNTHESITSEATPKMPEEKIETDQELPNLTEMELFNEVKILDDGSGPISIVSNLIYIQSGTERRAPIEKSDFETFFQFLFEKSEELPLDELSKVRLRFFVNLFLEKLPQFVILKYKSSVSVICM